jgi:hypothetical protein
VTESKNITTTLLKLIPHGMKHGYNNAGKQTIDNTTRGWQLESNNLFQPKFLKKNTIGILKYF